MIIAFDGGSFECGVTAFGAWSLVTVFLAGCSSLPQMCLGDLLHAQERCSPLGSHSPLCFDSYPASQELLFLSFLGVEWMGEQGHTAGLLYSVSQPARFTRWSEISYLFRVFSPHGWIERCVRVSMALCHTVSSGGWRNCCRSRLQPSTYWLLLYSVFQVLDSNVVVSLVAADNKL